MWVKTAYELAMRLNYIFENTKDKGIAFTRLAQWYDKISLWLSIFSSLKITKKKGTTIKRYPLSEKIGGFLLSRALDLVPLARAGLTSLFEMGRGVTPPI